MVRDSTTASERGERRKVSGANERGLACIMKSCGEECFTNKLTGEACASPVNIFMRFFYYCGFFVVVISPLFYIQLKLSC